MGKRTGRPRGRPPYPGLTPAEERVLNGLQRGLSNAEVAAELGISWTTVKFHVANVLGKLDAESRRELSAAERPRQHWRAAVPVALARLRPRPVIATTAVFAAVAAVAVVLLSQFGRGDRAQVRSQEIETPLAASIAPGSGSALPATTSTPIPEGTAPDVAALLARPLDLPNVEPGEPCPITPGRDASPAVASAGGAGPVVISAASGYVPLWPDPEAPGWFGTKIAWSIEKAVPGPVVLRGARIDGPGLLRWSDPPGRSPDWIEFEALLVGVSGNRAYRSGISGMPMSAPGCYAVQIDGEGFQQHIVFDALPESQPTGILTMHVVNPSGLRFAVGVLGLDDGGTFLVDGARTYARGPRGAFEWMPDGRSVMIASRPQLLIVGDDGTTVVPFNGEVMRGSPAPVGDRLAIVAFAGAWAELHVIAPASATPPVAPDYSDAPSWNPAWSPDGRHIAFMTERDGNPEVYLGDGDGQNQRRLTEDPEFDGYPAWSPDATHVAWESSRDFRRGIWLMDADGGNKHQLARTDSAIDWFPAWSPDGSRLAFVSNREGGWRVYTMTADGTDVRRLTDGPGSDWAPRWSPDGEWIAFISNREGTPEMWLVRPDGSDLQRLTTTTGGFVDAFAWTRMP